MMPDRAELRRQNEGRAQGVAAEARDLRDLPIFGGIPERAREAVVERVRKHVLVRQCEPGEVVLREGEYSDSAFFIVTFVGRQWLRSGEAGDYSATA